jgi:hypothetical protein
VVSGVSGKYSINNSIVLIYDWSGLLMWDYVRKAAAKGARVVILGTSFSTFFLIFSERVFISKKLLVLHYIFYELISLFF